MKLKTTLQLILALLLTSSQVSAQQWEAVNSQTNFILYGMHFPPGQNEVGYAAGMQYTNDAPGVIVKTSNGGQSWSQIYPVTGEIDGLEAVCFINPNIGFAAGWNNYFIKTTDGGSSWVPITVGTDVWYYVDIEFWDESNGIAVAVMNAGGSRVYKTDNGGLSWTMGGALAYSVLDICYANQNTLYAVGTGNVISKSVNGGQSWTNNYQSTGITMGVDFANTNFGVVGGEDGEILTTNDGGSSWSSFSTGYHSFYAVHVFDKDSAYVGGTDVDIFKTTDSGETWTLDYGGSGASTMYNFSFTANNTGFCSGSQGTMLRRDAPIATNFIADETAICTGNQIQFTDLSVGATGWDWYFEGGSPETSIEQNPIVTYYYAGDYDVTLTASNPEQSQTLTQENYIHVFEQPQPFISGASFVCLNQTIPYQTNNINGNTYTWDVVGGTISDGQNTSAISVIWDNGVGTGYVIVNETVNLTCTTIDTLNITIDECVSLIEMNPTDFGIYPNPVKNILNISFNGVNNEKLSFSIYNVMGIRLFEQDITCQTGQNEINLNLNNLCHGMYILEIKNSDVILSKMKFQKI
ncbi:MAG: T9SS type A sorting domain-containing protein [Bacteroidales bacterium]|nr:T9SS type A sorting domain-containing protein [Bacteroidales bacterium]